MHPIERLRYVARSHGGDQRLLVRETAGALRGLGLDPAGMVVACRRIVERHPTSGPLWWLCSSVVAAPAPFEVASRLADRIEDDPTPEVLIDSLAPDATVAVLGWPDLAGEATTDEHSHHSGPDVGWRSTIRRQATTSPAGSSPSPRSAPAVSRTSRR